MKKIAFYTLGCRANQYQTEVLKTVISNPSGRSPSGRGQESVTVPFSEIADIYVINTCTVTHDADRKSRQAIRRAIRQNPKARIIVAGCFAKLEKQTLLEMFPGIEILNTSYLTTQPSNHPVRIRANLMIQDGCEHFCSYCIVPYARGKITSKPLDQVISEAAQLVDAGAREIVLTGINLGTYQFNLLSVIRNLSKIPNLYRIRLSSLEPMYLNKELIDAIASTPKVCNHLHIPLQSGDNNILKAMNRKYCREDYLELINYVRDKIPDCGLTTDIIVGFPGEGVPEFQNTLNLVDQVKFSRIHIFPYSQRAGTPASEMTNQVEEKDKKERNKTLHKLRDKYIQEFAQKYQGKEVEILVESKGEGLTTNFIRYFFDDPQDSSGQLKIIRG